MTKQSIGYELFVMIDIEGDTNEQIRNKALSRLEEIKNFFRTSGYSVNDIIVDGETFDYNESPAEYIS